MTKTKTSVELAAGASTGIGSGNGGTTPEQSCELCPLDVDLSAFFDNPVV
jgi:hypothetical protein